MTVTITYDGTLSRVQITANALAAADVALVERSTDQVTWTTVRGASAWPVSSGALALTLDDYEFAPGVVNYYRVRGVQTGPSTFVGASAGSVGADGSRALAAPPGIIAGDLVLIEASTRNSGVGTVDVPTGWSPILASGNLALVGRIYDGVWAMPTVTYTGGAVNEDTIAQTAAFRNVDLAAVTTNAQLNGSAQNVAYPAVTVPQDNCTVLVLGWKQDDWPGGAATLAGMAEIGEPTSAAGNDASQVWDYQIQTAKVNIPAGSFVITGGAAAISRGAVAVFPKQAYLNEQSANITPVIDQVWIKNVSRPYLNAAFSVSTVTDPTIGGRGEAHEIIGRSLPVGITDLAANFTWEYMIRTPTEDDATKLRLLIASGDVLFVQVPAGSRLPSGYILVGQSVPRRFGPVAQLRHHRLQCREVAAPAADIVGGTSTWADVIAGFATWSDVLVTFPTWADLLGWVANPGEVIVP